MGWNASIISSEEVLSQDNDPMYLSALENLLSEYEVKLEKLENTNKNLQSKFLLSVNQNQLTSIFPSLRKKILHMSEGDVKKQISKFFKGSKKLGEVEDYKDFSLRFIDLALEKDQLPEDINAANHLIDVRISIARTSNYISVSEDEFQMSKYYKIFANISASPALENVMLKWTNLTTGELIKYKAIGFVSESDIQYVWARPDSGWDIGTYQVSLHKLNDGMSLIARRLYRITSIIDEGQEPVYDGPVMEKK